MPSDASIYDRIGGEDGVDDVVDAFYERVLADERLKPYFEDADVDSLRRHQRVFLTAVTGGPGSYDGRSMRAAHDHLDVTAAAFDRVVDHLVVALSRAGVSEADVEAIRSAVREYRSAIVAD